MIEQLMVKDYILFDQASVDFKRDMSAITGETGAGKSLLIDAISYLSGARVGSGIVRKGASQAVLQMVLSEPDEKTAQLLEENGFDAEEELIITRIVSDKGKSKVRINQQPATLAFLKTLTSRLIDVHSQMDTVQLMNPEVQLELLDAYAHTRELREQVAEAYREYSRVSRELKKATSETFSDDELEFVTAQLNEIDEAGVEENELEELQKKIRTAERSEKNMQDFSAVIYALHGDHQIVDSLYDAWKIMSRNDLMEEEAAQVHDAYYAMQALSEELQAKQEECMSEAGNLDEMQEREYEIKRLFRKYGGSYSAMMAKRESFNEKIDRIIHRQDLFDRLEKQKKEALVAYRKLARQLSEKRQAVFEDLQQQIESHAHDMMLEHAVFRIDRQEKEPSADGIDAIDFLVSMNPGQPLSSLKQSASGGELSRLMLALKVVFQASEGIDTIVFDEIDTGVSGKVALAMGSKMHSLARNYQVLCITHLPSVAVWADTHYRVSKSSDGQTTRTQIEELNEQQDLEELAVMSSGSANPSSIASMKELKESIRHGQSALSH